MENAAKALIIAGGILLAIMTLSLLVYMVGTTSRMAQSQDEKKQLEQLVAFNNEYEAYNKRVMYGTEVISVVNKAIVHNEQMAESKIDNPYYINIHIKTTQEFKTTYETTFYDGDELKYDDNITLGSMPDWAYNKFNGKNSDNPILAVSDDHTLGKFQENGEEFVVTDKNFVKFFEGSKTDITVTSEDRKTTYKMYSALTNFKRVIFRCTEVKYNEGRIQEMYFEQIK